MVHAPYRSMNSCLDEGATDGKYKKVVNGRSPGYDGDGTTEDRMGLDDVWFGIHEAPMKDVPGGRGMVRTPNYVPTKTPDSTKW